MPDEALCYEGRVFDYVIEGPNLEICKGLEMLTRALKFNSRPEWWMVLNEGHGLAMSQSFEDIMFWGCL